VTTGLRRDQHRGWEIRPGEITPTELNSSVYGVVGSITTIDPDDAASAGTSPALARADHQHAFTSGAAADLTKTATSAEGSASTHARSDHVHASSTLPWGLLAAPTTLTSNSSATSGTTDLDLAMDQTVTPAANRRIRLVFHCRGLQTDSANAVATLLKFKESGTTLNEHAVTPTDAGNSAGDGVMFQHVISGPSNASHTYEVFLQKVAGSANVFVQAASTYPAQFYVEDIGPNS
jgi:hypothetical protein